MLCLQVNSQIQACREEWLWPAFPSPGSRVTQGTDSLPSQSKSCQSVSEDTAETTEGNKNGSKPSYGTKCWVKNNSEKSNSEAQRGPLRRISDFLLEVGKTLRQVWYRKSSLLWSSLDVTSPFIHCWHGASPIPDWNNSFLFFNQDFIHNYN